MVTKAIHLELVNNLLTHFLQLSSGSLLEEESAVLYAVTMELLLWELMICDDFLPMKVYGENLRLFSK